MCLYLNTKDAEAGGLLQVSGQIGIHSKGLVGWGEPVGPFVSSYAHSRTCLLQWVSENSLPSLMSFKVMKQVLATVTVLQVLW